MVFKDVISAERNKIEAHIQSFMDQEMTQIINDNNASKVLELIKEYTLRGGKRVRSILVTKGYQAVGGKDLDRARKASVSLELIQSMLLIHDDIIDESPERRGAPSFHKLMEELHTGSGYRGDPVKFGYNISIIAGDLAESLGEKALISSGFPSDRILEALRLQADMIRDTGYGQILDIYSEALPEWTEELVLKVQKYKTARYTLEGPLHIGAALHGASEEQFKALTDFAIPMGIAFQIIDDILGFYGDPKRGGKEDLADIKEGKRTLLIMKALELVSEEERRIINDGLGNKELTVEEAEVIRSMIRTCGSEEYSRKMAKDLNAKGLGALVSSDLDHEVKDFLMELASYLLNRA